MDLDLSPCPNPRHKLKLFGRLSQWQWAKDYWCEENKVGHISRHYMSIRYVASKERDVALWSIIIFKLWIAIGAKK